MGLAYIRIDVALPSELLARFLQGIRDLEQTAPDDIQLAILTSDDSASMQEQLDLVKNISPGFAHSVSVPRSEMTAEQKARHDGILKYLNRDRAG